MTIQEKYKTKLRTLEECVRFIQNGDSIITSGAAGEPGVFLRSIPEWATWRGGSHYTQKP